MDTYAYICIYVYTDTGTHTSNIYVYCIQIFWLQVAGNSTQIDLNHKRNLFVLKVLVSSIFPPDPKASPLHIYEMVAKTFHIRRKSMTF